MNRTLRGIIVALFFVVFLLLSGGRRFGVDSESLFLPLLILVFFGLIVTIWFAPEPQRRIGVWGITLFALSTWPVVQHKAILIFLALAPLVVSEWRYSHPSAAQRMAGSLAGTVKTTMRNILIWLVVTISLVILSQLIRLIF